MNNSTLLLIGNAIIFATIVSLCWDALRINLAHEKQVKYLIVNLSFGLLGVIITTIALVFEI